jgi:hypothetical protein
MIVFQLSSEIKVMGQMVSQLEVREPLARDLRVMDREAGQVAKQIALIAHIAAVPQSSIDQLSVADFKALADIADDSEMMGNIIPKLVVREPVARDLRVMDKEAGPIAKQIALIAHLTGVPQSSIDELRVAEFRALADIADGFSAAGQKTGKM